MAQLKIRESFVNVEEIPQKLRVMALSIENGIRSGVAPYWEVIPEPEFDVFVKEEE